MNAACAPARTVYRSAHTRARRRRARRRRIWRNRLLALIVCLTLMRGAAFAAEAALDALFLDRAPVAQQNAPTQPEPSVDPRQALEDCLNEMPGSVSVLAVRPSDGLTFAREENRQYYAASLLKAPYALWLCRQAEAGDLDLNESLPGWDTARQAIGAMITRSDNQAAVALFTRWPANADTGFSDFLAGLGVAEAQKPRALSPATKITGTLSAADAVQILKALDEYFATGTALAGELKQAFLDADHNYLVTDWPMAKKYGNWTGALHDIAIVYAPDPYYVAVLTDWGDPVREAPECGKKYRRISSCLTAVFEA